MSLCGLTVFSMSLVVDSLVTLWNPLQTGAGVRVSLRVSCDLIMCVENPAKGFRGASQGEMIEGWLVSGKQQVAAGTASLSEFERVGGVFELPQS